MQVEVHRAMHFFASLAPIIIVLFFLQGRAAGPSSAVRADSKQAAASFDEGQSAQQRGDLNSAVRHYSKAIAADGSLYQAYYQRATALLGLGRDKEAEADLKKASELEPKFARAHRTLGQILLDRGETGEARRELARAIELEPTLTGVRIYYASALLRSNEPQPAIEHLRFAIAQKEEVPLAYALLGLAEERIGKPAEAFADYSRAIEMEAANAIAREGRGRIFESRADITHAIEDFTAAYRAQPTRETAIRLAELHTRAGQAQAAIQLYRRLLLDKPDDFAVRAEMACLMAENDQSEDAEKEMALVIAARPRDAKLLARAGDLFYKAKPAVAADYYKRAVEADPANIPVRVQLGASLVRSLQIEAALPVLMDVIARDPKNYAAHASLATALFKEKRYPEAASEFLWIIRSKPEIPASYYFLAISLDHLGDCEQANRAYQEFLRQADVTTNKNEVEEATTRSAVLQRLIKERKCRAVAKGKGK